MLQIFLTSDFFSEEAKDPWPGPFPLQSHARLGSSCPPGVLLSGDWVARSPLGGVYLLAPNESGLEIPSVVPGRDLNWSHMISEIRRYFLGSQFLEGRTPILVPSAGVDHFIDFMEVTGVASGRRWQLPTSPELHLKKLLCQGYERVFELSPSFRDDWLSSCHQPEFTMLEWYRAFSDLNDLLSDFEKLVVRLKEGADRGPVLEPERYSVRGLFKELFSFTLTPETSFRDLRELLQRQGVSFEDDDHWDDLFHRLFLEKIEPELQKKQWVYILDWPQSQASLSRVDKGWAQRVEIYYKGIELANGYLEENCPRRNEKVFNAQRELRKNDQRADPGHDPEFFNELQKGMPPAAGMALGLDRFFMVIQDLPSIDHTRPFPEK